MSIAIICYTYQSEYLQRNWSNDGINLHRISIEYLGRDVFGVVVRVHNKLKEPLYVNIVYSLSNDLLVWLFNTIFIAKKIER